MVGAVPDPNPWYRRMHVFALPSDDEQHPIALLEAMSHGLPVVATDVGDVRRTLPAIQQGLVCKTAEHGAPVASTREDGFSRALARLVGDAALRERLGEANRVHVERYFGLATVAERYAGVYDGAISGEVREGVMA